VVGEGPAMSLCILDLANTCGFEIEIEIAIEIGFLHFLLPAFRSSYPDLETFRTQFHSKSKADFNPDFDFDLDFSKTSYG
jgi:hypothetical protein